ncbi:MAG: DUF2505 domain-containing protein, partial [Acidimicrobiia bacterium]
FIAEGPGTAKRVIDGTLAVDVPLIGRSAERRILPGLLRRLDAEAEALRSWLARR